MILAIKLNGTPIKCEYFGNDKICIFGVGSNVTYSIKDSLLYQHDFKGWASTYYQKVPICSDSSVEENVSMLVNLLPKAYVVAFANILYEKRINQLLGYRL